MNLLLDTHVALWAITDSPKLSTKAREMIEAATASIWISAASIWEIAIKHGLDRRDMPVSSQDAMDYFQEAGYRFLPVAAEHAAAVETLQDHHRDPVDRILVAQALVEPMRLMTHDSRVARYSDSIVEV